MLHVPVTNTVVGVKMKKIFLVRTAGSWVNPILLGLYLPTRIEVEMAVAAVGAVVVGGQITGLEGVFTELFTMGTAEVGGVTVFVCTVIG